MNPLSLTCPECGADLSVEEGSEQVVCAQCGATVPVADVETPAVEAQPAPAAPEAPAAAAPATKKRNMVQLVFFIVWLLSSILVVGTCIYMGVAVGGKNGMIALALTVLVAGLPIVGGGAYVVFKLIPETADR